jgi:hypothetical protein
MNSFFRTVEPTDLEKTATGKLEHAEAGANETSAALRIAYTTTTNGSDASSEGDLGEAMAETDDGLPCAVNIRLSENYRNLIAELLEPPRPPRGVMTKGARKLGKRTPNTFLINKNDGDGAGGSAWGANWKESSSFFED